MSPPPPQVAQAICDCLEEEPPLLLHGYMNNSGYESVRAAIANHLNRQHSCALDSSHYRQRPAVRQAD